MASVNKVTAFFQKTNTHNLDPNVCWEWLGAGKGNGYGHVNAGTSYTPAHRLAYELLVGPIPDGLDVCHACDNRWCVNPDHLFVGTRKENMLDCASKGRTAGGTRKHLTEARAQEIKRRLNAGVPPSVVALAMDVNYGTVTAIAAGRSYAGVKSE